jgi:hypothetical protein
MSISVRSVFPLRRGIQGLKPNCGISPEGTPSMELRAGFPSERRQQKIFMSSASELFAQSSSRHRQAGRGRALRDAVWTLARRRAHSGLAQMFRHEEG